jgi:ferrous iron transport protein A
MSLAGATLDRRMRITGIRGNDSQAFRIMEMGVIEGAEVSVIRRAPLGDPLQIRVGDYELSLRRQHADMIDVEPF